MPQKRLLIILCFAIAACPSFLPAAEKKSAAEEMLERRQRVELMSFFLKDPKQAEVPGAPSAIKLFNQAVGFYEKGDLALARQSLDESLKYDRKNPFAYELLGDIDSMEQKLPAAKSNYEIAFNLSPRAALKQKIEKLQTEAKVEKNLATYKEEHFLIKYYKDEESDQGFELRELLRDSYRVLSQDFGFYFKTPLTVVLYDEKDFKSVTSLPHWVGGVYDGKVRMPINRYDFDERDLKAVSTHEMTHAFVAGMSERHAPPWINEGLAQYQENKFRPIDLLVFRSAVKTNTLMPLDELLAQETVMKLQDPLLISLFYQESFHLTNYLIERYGMFRVKSILAEMAKNKNSAEAIQEVLKISIPRLEAEWKDTYKK